MATNAQLAAQAARMDAEAQLARSQSDAERATMALETSREALRTSDAERHKLTEELKDWLREISKLNARIEELEGAKSNLAAAFQAQSEATAQAAAQAAALAAQPPPRPYVQLGR